MFGIFAKIIHFLKKKGSTFDFVKKIFKKFFWQAE
jgi:hypothetical protein